MTNKTHHHPTQTENWNRYYRPRQVRDLHLSAVRSALQQLMSAPHFPQALLFAGPKGTGKTTVARIVGAMLNDPVNEAAVEARFFAGASTAVPPLSEPTVHSPLTDAIFAGQSYVVQEMDAASNRGIDDIRSLKERAALPPSQGRISVIILDEVHMLTTEAFNALLKLLEEPPAHVVFVLATTEVHKLPPTIVSRCYLIRFQKATPQELQQPLQAIARDQAFSLDEPTLQLIARLADGSFRDAVKLLQQYQQQAADPTQMDAFAPAYREPEIITLLQAVVDKDSATVSRTIEGLRNQGVDEQQYLQLMLAVLHQDLLMSLGVTEGSARFDAKISRFFLQQLTAAEVYKPAPIPFLRLELLLLELIERARSKTPSPPADPPPERASALAPKPHSTKPLAADVVLVEPALPPSTTLSTVPAKDTAATASTTSDSASHAEKIDQPHQSVLQATDKPLGNGQLLCDKWSELVAKAAHHNFGLAALLRSAKPVGGSDGSVVVQVYYTFHKEQLLQKKWLTVWDQLTQELTGGVVTLDCLVASLTQSDLSERDTTAAAPLEALAVEALLS